MASGDFAPCQLIEHDEGSCSLLFTDFHPTEALFLEMGREGGGYGWHGVVDALVRMKAPHLAGLLDYDPEGSMFVALSEDREALGVVAGLIRASIADPDLLWEAIRHADPDLMD
jgi:hypothetical protein